MHLDRGALSAHDSRAGNERTHRLSWARQAGTQHPDARQSEGPRCRLPGRAGRALAGLLNDAEIECRVFTVLCFAVICSCPSQLVLLCNIPSYDNILFYEITLPLCHTFCVCVEY